jgi:hypothetical protein
VTAQDAFRWAWMIPWVKQHRKAAFSCCAATAENAWRFSGMHDGMSIPASTMLIASAVAVLFAPLGGCATSPRPMASDARSSSFKTVSRGWIAPELIQKVVRKNFDAFRRCYDNGLSKDTNLSGSIKVRFRIEFDGSVTDAHTTDDSTLADAVVRKCVVSEYAKLSFPKPAGGTVTVVYPIIFKPADEAPDPN